VLVNTVAVPIFAMLSVVAPKTGLWRFKDEDRVRTSEAPQYWF
jgi:hypothetical protein